MRFLILILAFARVLSKASLSTAPAGPWDAFNYAPSSKTVDPVAIRQVSGAINDLENLTTESASTTLANGSWVALDFGKEVGGLISLNIDSATQNAAFTLAFTESPEYIRPTASDDSSYPSANTTYDGVLHVATPLSSGHWTQPAATLRGGFRFLTIAASGNVTFSNVSCAISFMPHVDNLRAYTGYFSADDPLSDDSDFLTKLWYAGAYTVQTNTVALNTGRHVPFAPAGSWENDATLGVAGPIIVDGAKRDRAVWPGDMGIAVPTQFVSTGDLIATRNALSTMFAAQNPKTGALPESGPPLSQTGSDTYHAWTLIGTHTYYLYSADDAWLAQVWANYTKAVAFLEAKVDATGLMNVTGLRDWARVGGGGHNAEGNAILYNVLTTASSLAGYANDTALSAAWARNASALKTAFNDAFWLANAGMYRDNATTTLCPQDANSFAVLFNLTTSPAQAAAVSAGLTRNWGAFGAVAPELPGTVAPFIGGFELQAHFVAGHAERAMELMRRQWGYMLTTNLSVESTLLEGYTANGSLAYRSDHGYNFDPAYTSHAHGWSTGPTSTLTFFVLGLTVTAPAGRAWALAPHINGTGLHAAEGGFATNLGRFGAKWSAAGTGWRVEVDTPVGTTGVVAVNGHASVDGVKADVADGQVKLEGGKHTVVVTAVDA